MKSISTRLYELEKIVTREDEVKILIEYLNLIKEHANKIENDEETHGIPEYFEFRKQKRGE